MKKTLFTIAIVLILVGSIFAFNIEKIAENLKLTDTQTESIEKITDESQRKAIDLRAELEKAQLDMKKIMSEDKVNRGDATATQERIMEIEKQLKMQRLNTMLDIREQLTDEQRAEFKKTMHDGKGMGKHQMMKSGKGGGCGMHSGMGNKGSKAGCGMHSENAKCGK